jgi:hypothetical protein
MLPEVMEKIMLVYITLVDMFSFMCCVRTTRRGDSQRLYATQHLLYKFFHNFCQLLSCGDTDFSSDLWLLALSV